MSSNYRVNGFSKKLTAFVGLGISFGIAGFLLKGDNPSATPDRWASTVSSMISGRSNACSVLLADGRIFVAGGEGASGTLASTEIFDANGRFQSAAPMSAPRSSQACALMPDGTVMVAGGRNGSGISNGVTGLKYGVPRIVGALVKALFIEDSNRYLESLAAYGEPHFDPGIDETVTTPREVLT